MPTPAAGSACPGRRLCERFYRQAVAPLLGDTPHAAALLGDGSEVLGFDDDISPDHGFTARVQVFLPDGTDPTPVQAALAALPDHFEGHPVSLAGPDDDQVRPVPPTQVTSGGRFFTDRLGFDPAAGVTLTDWLITPTHTLATLVDGIVYHDPAGLLSARRAALQWYPEDVWRYALASAWLKVSHEEAFIGRTGSRGDDLGSAIVTVRLARELMRLAFLIERRWAPYSKWLGTAFTRLPIATRVGPHLSGAVHADDWRGREAALCAAQSVLADATNALGLAEELDPAPRRFFDRDIRVLFGHRFTTALAARVTDPDVRELIDRLGWRRNGEAPAFPGTIDQATDSVEVLMRPDRHRAAARMLGM